jgi:hypothetical protein
MAATAATEKAGEPERPSENVPIVIDLGKKSRKRIKALRRGEGALLEEVIDAIEELKKAGTVSASAQPVIVIVRQKRCGKSGGIFPMR